MKSGRKRKSLINKSQEERFRPIINKTHTMKALKFIIVLLIATNASLQSQIIRSKLDLTAGISAREYLHAGLRYQYTDITQFGIAIGNDLELNSNEKISTYSLDHMIHFGALSMYSSRPVWYARQGLTYSINREGADRTRKYTYINLGAGREFSVNTWLGFNADLGFIWQINSVTEENNNTRSDNLRQIFPLARIQVFISF
jgi:hypothetical protein